MMRRAHGSWRSAWSRSELLRDQSEAMLVGGPSQLLVPTCEFDLFAGGERQRAGKLYRVISTKGMSAGTLGRLRQKSFGRGVDVQASPRPSRSLNPLRSWAGLRRPPLRIRARAAVASTLGDCGASDPFCFVVRLLSLLSPRLVHQELDQGTGIEIRESAPTLCDVVRGTLAGALKFGGLWQVARSLVGPYRAVGYQCREMRRHRVETMRPFNPFNGW